MEQLPCLASTSAEGAEETWYFCWGTIPMSVPRGCSRPTAQVLSQSFPTPRWGPLPGWRALSACTAGKKYYRQVSNIRCTSIIRRTPTFRICFYKIAWPNNLTRTSNISGTSTMSQPPWLPTTDQRDQPAPALRTTCRVSTRLLLPTTED